MKQVCTADIIQKLLKKIKTQSHINIFEIRFTQGDLELTWSKAWMRGSKFEGENDSFFFEELDF